METEHGKGREGYGRWKDVRTPWSSLMFAHCMESTSLQIAARVKLVGVLVHVSCDCVTSVRT